MVDGVASERRASPTKRYLLAVVGALVAFGMTGCLGPSSTPKLAGFGDGPDPAGIPVYYGVIGIYTTATPGLCLTVGTDPFEIGCLSNGSTGHAVDALPTPPSWWGGPKFTWAPTVRYVAGRFLMMFSASPKPSGGAQPANCIGAATATSFQGPFTPVNGLKWCDAADPVHVGFLDPSIFQAPNGTLWLYYSREWKTGSTTTHSEIVAQQLSPNGTTRVGGPSTLLSWSDVAGLNAGHNGTNPYVENPQMVADPYNGYDLLVSVGTWNDPGYATVEVPCLVPNSACIPGEGGVLPLSLDKSLVGTGGASLVVDTSPNGNRLLFHGWPSGPYPGIRYPWVESTYCFEGSVNVSCGSASATATSGADAPDQVRALSAPVLPLRPSVSRVLPPGAVEGTPDRSG